MKVTRRLLGSESRLTDANTILSQSLFNRAGNESKAQESWWMEKVSPYLPDILKSTGAIGGAKGLFGK